MATHYAGSSDSCAAILFRHDRRDVAHSRQVSKALAKLGETEKKVFAVSGSFTTESEALLRTRGVEMLCYGGSFWTDATHTAIKLPLAKLPRFTETHPQIEYSPTPDHDPAHEETERQSDNSS